jgi:hypothetical protein
LCTRVFPLLLSGRQRKSDAQIEQAFQDAWAEFGDDKSTEFLIQITADLSGVDYDRVVSALAAIHATQEDD